MLYQTGVGVDKDYAQALQCIKSRRPELRARQQRLATMYQKGWGVAKNGAQAKFWNEKAKTNASARRLVTPITSPLLRGGLRPLTLSCRGCLTRVAAEISDTTRCAESAAPSCHPTR